MDQPTVTTANGNWLVQGVQLRPRKIVPARIGDFILWMFFHRIDTETEVTLSGFMIIAHPHDVQKAKL